MLFINVDGCNGSGKTTITTKLTKCLQDIGLRVKCVHFHRRGTLIGDTIQHILNKDVKLDLESMQMLYAVDQLDFVNSVYPDLAESYDVLITDRYYTSLLAIGSAMGLELERLKTFIPLLKNPQIHFILTTETEELLKRVSTQEYVPGQTDDIFESKNNLLKIKDSYAKLKNIIPNVVEIDTTVSTSSAVTQILAYISKLI